MASEVLAEAPVLELLPVGIITVDRDWVIRLWNRTLAEWTGIQPGDALGRDLGAVLPHFSERRYLSRLEDLMEGGPPVVFSYQLHGELFPDRGGRGPRRVRYCTASSLPGASGILFAVEDRTEVVALVREARAEVGRRLAVEEELRSALAAKEMLIREASHRVKNNLAMVVSLISLDSGQSRDPGVQAILADLASRIDSIALIHELLYKGEIGADVGLDAYLEKLCATIVGAFAGDGLGVELRTQLEPARLDLDSTLYVGMITSELVTNCLKYGRQPGKALALDVRLQRKPDGACLELLVADNGPGFPGEGMPSSGSLGWSLVTMLVGELGGRIEVLPGPGAATRIYLPERRREPLSPQYL